ncbi:hypothetical protein BH23CHL8_BH23CHL8_24230 [soil metagenome]
MTEPQTPKVEDIEDILADPEHDEEKEAERRFTRPINPDPLSALAMYPPPEVDELEMEAHPPSAARPAARFGKS